MTEFEEKMLREAKEQTEILSKIKSYALGLFMVSCAILGAVIAN